MAFFRRFYQGFKNRNTVYQNNGFLHPAIAVVFGLFLVSAAIFGLLTSVIPLIFWSMMPPAEITAASFADTHIFESRHYTFTPDDTFPLGLVSWYEQRNYGITTYRTSDSYWGLYQIGDYYVYRTEEVFDNLLAPVSGSLTGRFERIGGDNRRKILEIIPDIPPEVVFVKFRTASASDSLSEAMGTGVAALIAIVFGQWAYSMGQKTYPNLPRMALIQWQHIVWLWERLKQFAILFEFIKGLLLLFKNMVTDRRNTGQSPSSQAYKGTTITLSPDKVRKVDIDEAE